MATAETQRFQRRMERIEQLLRGLEREPPSQVRENVQELVQTLLEAHGDCLERMLGIVYERGGPSADR